MRQLTYLEAGLAQWREVPDPTLADPAGALVRRIAAKTLCTLVDNGVDGCLLGPQAGSATVVSWDDAADGWLKPAVKLVVSRSQASG